MKNKRSRGRQSPARVRMELVAGIIALLMAPTSIAGAQSSGPCSFVEFFNDDFNVSEWTSINTHSILPNVTGDIHVEFSNECVTRTFSTALPHEQLRVNLRYWSIGSWDAGEAAVASIAGSAVLQMERPSPFDCTGWSDFGSSIGVSAESTFPTTCYVDVSATAAHTSVTNFDLSICSTTKEAIANESFGFSQLSIEICQTTTCGNGVVETGEECDDGDLDDGDGCSATCTVEPGSICNGEPSVCVTNVPTVSEWGVVAMTLFMLGAATIIVRRRTGMARS